MRYTSSLISSSVICNFAIEVGIGNRGGSQFLLGGLACQLGHKN